MNLIAIDGGVHKCAVASFVDGVLVRAWFVSNGQAPGGMRPDLVVVERPIIRGNNTPNPQDIVDLAWSSAALAYSFGAPVKTYTPHEWKGGVPKPMHHARILFAAWPTTAPEVLPLDWRKRVTDACLRGAKGNWRRPGAFYYGTWEGHNLLDSVALGLYALGRSTE